MRKYKEREYTVPVTLQLPEEIHKLVKLLAFESDMSISRYCRIIVENYVTKSENQNENN